MLKTCTTLLSLLVMASLVSAQETAKAAIDASKMYGDWEYVSGMRAGEEVAKERLEGVVSINEDTWTLPGGPGATFVMDYVMDASKDPAKIDFTIKEGPVPEGAALGIVTLDGDQLTLCYHPMG
ncbi:MAG: TIGR03067 domain-containing protein, partial [Planctomycetota bacterium]